MRTSDHSSEGNLGLHGVAQFGGVLCVALAVDQHQRIPLVVLDDVRDAAEKLKKQNKDDKVRMKSSLKEI